MGKINYNARMVIHTFAARLRASPPSEVQQFLGKIPNFSKDAAAMEIYSIYIRLYEFSNEDTRSVLQEIFMKYFREIASPGSTYIFEFENDDFTIHEAIVANFFVSIMKENYLKYSDDRAFEFNSIVNVLGEKINRIIALDGNTPLIWSIANSNFPNIAKFLTALQANGLIDKINFDIHCKHYAKGSALFLACAKGENHQDTNSLFKSSMYEDRMEFVIRDLLTYGASPTDRSGSNEQYSPLDIMVIRRSPLMLRLLIKHLKAPLNKDEITSLNSLAKISYTQVEGIISNLSPVYTLPSEDEWNKKGEEIKNIVAELTANSNLTSQYGFF
ncbi:ankyrin repeat domain-containing protein [Legionella brunensis]|uniref:Ankyrin repeat protein n=1 Tax=Legionella brunensis TaxID=29422 RepID=A0A0W0SU81_9GAMM|nr:ankyrin repeat domain-containing protein [Legionella brunensis]KTC86896.1 hypothetical protein Lbru_0125 [Legionella brunensis]